MHPSSRVIRRLFALCLAVVYLSVFPYLQGLNNPNENTRVYLTMALVEQQSFRIDAIVKRYGWTNDMARVPHPDGTAHYATAKGPLLSYLGVPIYAAQRGVARLLGQRLPDETSSPAEAAAWLRTTTLTLQLFGTHLPCLLFLLWLERRLRRWSLDPTLRLGAIAAVGLGTNYLAYSFCFVSHAWSSLAAFVALDRIASARLRARGLPARARPADALAAGLLAGLPTLLEYQGASLSVILGLYGASIYRRPRTLLAFGAGALLDVLALMAFQRGSFGSPWSSGVLYMENPAFRAVWQQGFFGFSKPSPGALGSLWFDGSFGLFATSPWLLLSLAGLALAPALAWGQGRARRERRITLGVSATMFLVLSLLMASGSMWRGGWTIGPRYLGAAPGLLLLPGLALAEALARRLQREPVRLAASALSAASFVRGGAIALLVTTLPESIERPLLQVAVPFVRQRVFPHLSMELLGIRGIWPWYLAAGAACAAVLLALLAAPASHVARAARAAGALALAALLLWPAFRLPAGKADDGPAVRALFMRVWEPAR